MTSAAATAWEDLEVHAVFIDDPRGTLECTSQAVAAISADLHGAKSVEFVSNQWKRAEDPALLLSGEIIHRFTLLTGGIPNQNSQVRSKDCVVVITTYAGLEIVKQRKLVTNFHVVLPGLSNTDHDFYDDTVDKTRSGAPNGNTDAYSDDVQGPDTKYADVTQNKKQKTQKRYVV